MGRSREGAELVTAYDSGAFLGMRNRIINGDMRIDQRNAGASSTFIGYTVDRFFYDATQSSKITWQQNQDTGSLPAGFTHYLGFKTSSAFSVASGDYFVFGQLIEGLNVADLDWGAANAKPITISFGVYSSLTGTFGGAIRNSAANRSYPFTYTISSANTWETKTITIPGDTSGTWLTTTGIGLRLTFGLGSGATYAGTAGAWAATNVVTATGCVSVAATLNATFRMTGLQVEVGSVATPFERRPYGTELALCQRYYYEFDTNGLNAIPCWAQSANAVNCRMMVPVTMRTSITASYAGTIGDNTQDWSVYNAGAWTTLNSIALTAQTNQSFRMEMTVTSGIASSAAVGLYALNIDGGAKLRASAEL